MRALITLVTTLSVGALLALDNPEKCWSLMRSISSRGAQLWNDKEIRIDGLRLLSRAEIEKILPLQRSVGWWHVNATEIQAQLSHNAWVEEATLSSCPDTWASRWGCFLLRIKERQPMFVATFDGNSWVIDREGAFLVPLSEFVSRNFSGRLISVRGVAASANSPDIVRAQLSAASELCDTLEKQVSKPIRELEFLGQGDFAIVFDGVPFPVIFAAGKDAKVPLLEQGERCSALIKQLGPRLADVARVDLAFDRVGVVQFKPAPAAHKQPAAG